MVTWGGGVVIEEKSAEKLTLEKKILPRFLPGIEPPIFQSWVHSTNRVVLAPLNSWLRFCYYSSHWLSTHKFCLKPINEMVVVSQSDENCQCKFLSSPCEFVDTDMQNAVSQGHLQNDDCVIVSVVIAFYCRSRSFRLNIHISPRLIKLKAFIQKTSH